MAVTGVSLTMIKATSRYRFDNNNKNNGTTRKMEIQMFHRGATKIQSLQDGWLNRECCTRLENRQQTGS
jgi:hypothetical protein